MNLKIILYLFNINRGDFMKRTIYNIFKVLFIISLFTLENMYINIIGYEWFTIVKIYFILYILLKILAIILEIYFNIQERKNN